MEVLSAVGLAKGCGSKHCGVVVVSSDGEFCFAVVSVFKCFDCDDVVLLFCLGMVFWSVWIDVNKLDRKQTS